MKNVECARGFTLRRATLAAAFMLIMFLAGCSGDGVDESALKPSVTEIAPQMSTAGDTILISGANFDPDPGSNEVFFSPCGIGQTSCARRAQVLSATAGELLCRVPDGALSGGVWVQGTHPLSGVIPLGIERPPLASNGMNYRVRFESGDVGKAFYGGSLFEYTFPHRTADEEYLLVLFSSASLPVDATQYHYSVSLYTSIGLEAAPEDIYWAEKVPARPRRSDPSLEFQQRIRRGVRELLEAQGAGARQLVTHGTAGGGKQAPIQGQGDPPETVYLQVLDVIPPPGAPLIPDYFVTVTADLKYTGTHTALYVDRRTHVSCITDQEAWDLGELFDLQIHETNTNYFGDESDINGDSRVAILLTPEVNEMTSAGQANQGFIAGFFLPVDLLPTIVNPMMTNGMEIFYSIVPDPENVYGNEFEKPAILETIQGILAHEFQHMIMFNYRVLIYGGGVLADYLEELWIDEGMSHIAEDLNGFDQQNIYRSNDFLADPGNVNIVFKSDDNLEARGGIYLFFRHVGDRFGELIFRSIVQSHATGKANVEGATGLGFNELFADWSAACYLDGRNITGDERFGFSSIDLQGGDFDPLAVIDPGAAGVVNGLIKANSPEYILLHIGMGSELFMSIDSENTGSMNACIIRLP